MGTGVERTLVAVVDRDWRSVGQMGAGSLRTGRPCSPTFAQINQEGRTQSGEERGRQSGG